MPFADLEASADWEVWVGSGCDTLRDVAERYLRVRDSVVQRLPRQSGGADVSWGDLEASASFFCVHTYVRRESDLREPLQCRTVPNATGVQFLADGGRQESTEEGWV